MTMIERLKADQLSARKNKDFFRITILSTLLGEAIKVGKDNGNRDTTDQEAIAVVKKFKKNAEDTVRILHNSRQDDIFVLGKEIVLYDMYIPQQLSEDDLKHEIYMFFLNNDKENNVTMKDIMTHLKANFAGLYDGKSASQITNEMLKRQ